MSKKVNEMDKEELVQYMRSSREIHKKSESPAWRRAFELYRKNVGPADMDCSGCWRMVNEWLQKV